MSEIRSGQHVFVAGRTGCGKSQLVEAYLSSRPNVICLDTKGDVNWNTIPDVVIYDRLDRMIEKHSIGKAIYRPRWQELNFDYTDKFFEYIYLRRNTDVWIDEVMSIELTPYYKACLTRGRSLNISCWNVTQRPKTIPLICISESTHFFVFDLQLEADRKRIMEVVPFEEINTIPSKINGEYSFWYYNFKMNSPIVSKLDLKGVK